MAHLDLGPTTPKSEGIAEPHQSKVADIRRAVELGPFSTAEADLIIGRIRAPTTGDAESSPDETVT